MTLAAYPGGIEELRNLPEWRDLRALHGEGTDERRILVDVLRLLHARTAARLAVDGWRTPDRNEQEFLIEESDLRHFYGPTIGLVAHSHWWPISRVESELNRHLGAMPPTTGNDVDILKLAALLRVADATHLDRRRAPPFVRALDRPSGVSELHWQFQGRLSFPRLQGDALQFTAGESCPIGEAESWWLGYDAFVLADRELHDTDLVLRELGRPGLRARRVKGAAKPTELAIDVPVVGWKPIDTRLHVSDVPRIVETLGGGRLYGQDWWAPLRELLQNAVDAVQARRRLQARPDWGAISVRVFQRDETWWLSVEDDGVGMSERVLTKSLIDFGASFWRSPAMAEEFPGLAASGMKSIGQFGIGFFSVFMLGDVVSVVSRRFDDAAKDALKLQFHKGLASRPLLSSVGSGEAPPLGGTRVEIQLWSDPVSKQGFKFATNVSENDDVFSSLFSDEPNAKTLSELVEQLVPASEVTISVHHHSAGPAVVLAAGDWRVVDPTVLSRRVRGPRVGAAALKKLMQPITNDVSEIVGRAALWPSVGYRSAGALTAGGFRIQGLPHLLGVVVGEVETASRDHGHISLSAADLRKWADHQGKILSRMDLDDEQKARCAEVILACGAPIRSLPIICHEGRWYNTSQLKDLLAKIDNIRVIIGEPEYDDDDEVSQSSFDGFELSSDIFVIPSVSSDITSRRPNYSSRKSLLHGHFEKVMKSVWRSDIFLNDDSSVVGQVNYTDIYRSVMEYSK